MASIRCVFFVETLTSIGTRSKPRTTSVHSWDIATNGYTQVVKNEVLPKHHRAFLIAGANHFMRGQAHPNRHDRWNNPGYIELELRRAGAKTFLIVAGTNAVKGYDDLDHRLNSWPAPSIALLNGNWVGELSTMPVITGGTVEIQSPVKLKDAADGLMYLGPRDSLISVEAAREEVDGTAYGKELLRRMTILGFHLPYVPDAKESPQFDRPEPGNGPPAGIPRPHQKTWMRRSLQDRRANKSTVICEVHFPRARLR